VAISTIASNNTQIQIEGRKKGQKDGTKYKKITYILTTLKAKLT